MSGSASSRGVWGSKLGFILAASGSAIGLGNIIFFGANAYRFGGGAFYVPYFVALFLLGIPMMIVELGLGTTQRSALPGALHKTTGKAGEFWGWWSLLNAIVIAMYYITILAWVAGMLIKGIDGSLYARGAGSVGGTLTKVLSSWITVILAFVIWGLNIFFLFRGTDTIEKSVKVFVPLMWFFMAVLVIRGLTLDSGFQGVWYLFTPNFSGITEPTVWQGAFSQMFFSLSLGLGTMTAYASYLPKKSDVVANGSVVSFMNCGFEFVAGLAIFSMLFAFTLHPGETTGTLGLSLYVVPSGIAEFPAAQTLFACIFFFLLLIAGLSSSISIIESPVAAIRDKFGWSRRRALLTVSAFGALGSLLFALPMVLEQHGKPAQPLGLSLLELFDHWAFGYSLLIVGLVEAIAIGWGYGITRLREQINENARFKLGPWFDGLIKYVVPGLIILVLSLNVIKELGITIPAVGLTKAGFYKGDAGTYDGYGWMPMAVFGIWLVVTVVGAYILTRSGKYPEHDGGDA